MTDPFHQLPKKHFAAILADPPWRFDAWSGKGTARSADNHYQTMTMREIARLPVDELAADDCALFMWACWPSINDALRIIDAWGFQYKTCAFSWMKADPYRLFADDATPFAGMGYWTRANTEPCLLATRGRPKRLHADVRQGIIAPRREHSRKPDEIHGRIERLVGGPYLEMFARQARPGWTVWGNQTDKFDEYDATADVEASFSDAYAAVRERVAEGGPSWPPKDSG
jgi:N6-adenosine-specific RNA methylase IME4